MKPFPLVPLLDICFPKQWKTLSSEEMLPTGFPVYGANGQIGYYSEFTHEEPTLMITCRGATCGTINLSMPFSYIGGNAMALDRLDLHRVDRSYLYHCLQHRGFRDAITGAAQPQITRQNLARVEIPLPPLDEQRRIAAILDKADALRRKRKRAIELLGGLTRSIFLEMFGDPVHNPKGLPKIPLGDLIRVKSGDGLIAKVMAMNGSFPVYGGNGINGYHDQFMFEHPQLVIGRVGVYCGTVHLTRPRSWITDNALYISETKRPISQLYLKNALIEANLNQYAGRAAQPLISGGRIYPIEILLPSESDQRFFETQAVKAGRLHEHLKSAFVSNNILFSSLQNRVFSGGS